MKDLNRHVIRKYASDWYDIGIKLGLNDDLLNEIKRKQDSTKDTEYKTKCFQRTLGKWLSTDNDATWKTLEVAITNMNRTKLGLGQVDDVYGKYVY